MYVRNPPSKEVTATVQFYRAVVVIIVMILFATLIVPILIVAQLGTMLCDNLRSKFVKWKKRKEK